MAGPLLRWGLAALSVLWSVVPVGPSPLQTAPAGFQVLLSWPAEPRECDGSLSVPDEIQGRVPCEGAFSGRESVVLLGLWTEH